MLDNQYDVICEIKLSLSTKKTNRSLQATEGDESCVGITGGYPINLSLLFSSITGYLKKSRLDSIPPSNVKSVIEIIARLFILLCDRCCRTIIMTGKPPVPQVDGRAFQWEGKRPVCALISLSSLHTERDLSFITSSGFGSPPEKVHDFSRCS